MDRTIRNRPPRNVRGSDSLPGGSSGGGADAAASGGTSTITLFVMGMITLVSLAASIAALSVSIYVITTQPESLKDLVAGIPSGDRGFTGDMGLTGPRGSQGSAGSAGANGADGANGTSGVNGTGSSGIVGTITQAAVEGKYLETPWNHDEFGNPGVTYNISQLATRIVRRSTASGAITDFLPSSASMEAYYSPLFNGFVGDPAIVVGPFKIAVQSASQTLAIQPGGSNLMTGGAATFNVVGGQMISLYAIRLDGNSGTLWFWHPSFL